MGRDGSLGAGFKPPGERPRRALPLLLSGAGMGPLSSRSTTFGYGEWCIEGRNLGRDPNVAAAVRGGPGDARGGVGSGEGAANAAVIALRGDEAIHDPGGGREGGGGDGFAVQSGHGVIVSIGDVLRACQAAAFCFRDIGREPAVLPSSARATVNTHEATSAGWARLGLPGRRHPAGVLRRHSGWRLGLPPGLR